MARIARHGGAALIVAGFGLALSGAALAQSADGRGPISFQSIFDNFATGSIGRQPAPVSAPAPAPAPPRAANGAKPWSGEDGASGHPAMTAAAIRQAAADFPHGVARMWPEAARRHISRESFVRFTANLSPDLRIMDLMDSQPEFTKAVWDYLDILVNDARIARGREFLARYKAEFDAVEHAYGVDRYVIASIWGIESNYSTLGGDRSVLNSTATLACVGRRQKYFKDEFLAALEILHRGDLRPGQLRGSWAGAFGGTQFMPTSFKRFAVDFDGDGRRDVVDNPADLIASTANNLKKDGWQSGQTWGYEVTVPRGFNYMLADRGKVMTLAQWQHLGVGRAGGRAFPRPHDKAYLLAPAGADGPGFLMLQNFRVIMKYNPAEAYALAIGHFADRLRGGGPFVQGWPRDQRVLSRSERLEMQQLLARAGYYRGEADGMFGSETRKALRGYQAAAGMAADGFATAELLDRLRRR
jgi:lytic murein transglycosylase